MLNNQSRYSSNYKPNNGAPLFDDIIHLQVNIRHTKKYLLSLQKYNVILEQKNIF